MSDSLRLNTVTRMLVLGWQILPPEDGNFISGEWWTQDPDDEHHGPFTGLRDLLDGVHHEVMR